MTASNQEILARVAAHLEAEEAFQIDLPDGGLLKMESPLPFLVVSRLREQGRNYFPNRMGKTEAAFLIAADNELLHQILDCISKTLSAKFNGFLIFELWKRSETAGHPFLIHIHQKTAIETARKLAGELNYFPVHGRDKTSKIEKTEKPVAPPNREPLLPATSLKQYSTIIIGLEIAPVYLNQQTGRTYPLLLRELRAHFSRALKKSIFEYIRLHTSFNASHFQMLGRTVIDDKAREIDHELAGYSKLFDFLMLVTPINVTEAWQKFRETKFNKDPVFHYRPMPVDPELVKRKLYNLPIEDLADPTIAFLYRDKRKEIDRMLNMMLEREKPDFLLSSLQLFGPVTESLLEMAQALLIAIPAVTEAKTPPKRLHAAEFALLARKELEWLQLQYPDISTTIRIADDVEGISVSRGVLNINSGFGVSEQRAPSLLQHEVGTHIVTYYNGRAQPLELFSIGVPGYEELQEGLAVLAEYLTGGLTPARMRTLAARVLAVHEMISGKKFTATFQLLTEKFGFAGRSAFNICMRVYRGGGLTKDAVYLKGFINIIEYIKKGRDLKELLIGKIREDYLPVVQELIHRRILVTTPVLPRYLTGDFQSQLKAIKEDGNIFKLIQEV